MFNLLMILVGSLMIGFGAESALVGGGVAAIAIGFHAHFNTNVGAMHVNLVKQMRKIMRRSVDLL